MKSTRRHNSMLMTPLNLILGSKGHIVILRKLFDTHRPMSHSELIELTDLSRQGVYDVVGRLIEYGVLTYSGSGRHQSVIIREDYPLFDVIDQLFEKEKERFNLLIDALQTKIKQLNPQPISAWIFGKVSQGEDEYGDPLQIGILGDLKVVDSMVTQMRNQIMQDKVESEYDVTIDIRGMVKADLETRPALTEGILLWGVDPRTYLESYSEKSRFVKSHQDFDATSLEEAKAWSELLKIYPEIIPRTVSYLNEQVHHLESGEKKELMEWRQLLESSSFQRLKKFLESDSERSIRLRQSLPFWSVLNEKERKVFEKMRSTKV